MAERTFICTLIIGDLGSDALRVSTFEMWESIDEGCRGWVTVEVAGEPIPPADLLGKNAVLAIELDGETVRRFHGVVLSCAVQSDHTCRIRIELAARVERLKLGRNSRLFQQLTVEEIAKKVLEEAGLAADDQDWRLQSKLPKREQVYQRGESDFELMRRLLSEEGVGFAVVNGEDKDQLLFFDHSPALPVIPGDDTLHDRAAVGQLENTVTDLAEWCRGGSDSVMLRDYDFKRPALDLTSADQADGAAGREVYLHPGDYCDDGEGKRLAKCHLQRQLAPLRGVRGKSDCPRLAPAHLFHVGSCPRSSLNAEYLVLSLVHRGDFTLSAGEAFVYQVELEAIPKEVPYRPPATRGTFATAAEPAFVTCPSAEEIHADEFGRVKVRYPWDRSGKTDDKSSGWLRVGQAPLGGSMILPRGQFEVLVNYELSDLDRPFVSGHLYNADLAPPYALPGGKTRTALQTATTSGGPGANEVRFDDSAGAEEMFFNASKDLTLSVENDAATAVGNNRNEKVGSNSALRVGGEHVATVKGNRELAVSASQTIDVGKDFVEGVGGSDTVTVGAMRKVKVGGDHSERTSGSLTRTVGALQAVTALRGYNRNVAGSSTTTVGAAWLELVNRNRSSTVQGNRQETVGGVKMIKAQQASVACGKALLTTSGADAVDCGGSRNDSADGELALTAGGGLSVKAKDIVITAEDSLQLVAGAVTFKLSSGGEIEIDAPKVDLKGVDALTQRKHESN